MPTDKHNNGNPAKPLTPNLSSAFRQSKSVLTPKAFGSASPQIPAKRALHTESARGKRPLDKRPIDNQSTPTFSGNVTPRSAARKSRIGTESPSTPDVGSVSRSPRPRSMVERDGPQDVAAGLGVYSVGSHTSASPALSRAVDGKKAPALSQKGSRSFEGSGGSAPAPQFFHADDARSAVSSLGTDGTTQHGPKAIAFFYADEAAAVNRDTELRPISREIAKLEGKSKVFNANEQQSNHQPAIKSRTVGTPASPSHTSPRFLSPELQKNGRPIPRPPSPLKEPSYANQPATPASPRSKNLTSQVKTVDHGSRQGSSLPSSPKQEPRLRRTSLSSATSMLRKPFHQKSTSTSSIQSTPTKRPPELVSLQAAPAQQLAVSMASPTSPELSTSNSASLASTDTSSLTLDTGPTIAHLSPFHSPTHSGTRPQHPAEQLQKMNELAANARRERKVLDLEISNSSLLAINKTLEREMRKQSAELRRFRRLSRAGRFSIANSSLRSTSAGSSLGGLMKREDGRGDLSDLEEMSDQESEGSDKSDDDLDSSFDDDSSSVFSPSLRSEYDARQRAKDEKRLMLDLTKHRQLLIDSQKMSQSIKRCLGWTEELIKEANRALTYHVKVSDVELGGRVLSMDDEEEKEEEEDRLSVTEEIGPSSKGLLSPSATMTMLDDVTLWAHALSQLDGDMKDMILDEPEALQPD